MSSPEWFHNTQEHVLAAVPGKCSDKGPSLKRVHTEVAEEAGAEVAEEAGPEVEEEAGATQQATGNATRGDDCQNLHVCGCGAICNVATFVMLPHFECCDILQCSNILCDMMCRRQWSGWKCGGREHSWSGWRCEGGEHLWHKVGKPEDTGSEDSS